MRGIVSADVGLGVEMCAEKVGNTAWAGDCLRRCRGKCGEVRRRDAIQSVYRWMPAHMSGEGEEENMREEDPDSSLSLRMTGWGLGMTEGCFGRQREDMCAWRMPLRA